jgi:adsorption protein B
LLDLFFILLGCVFLLGALDDLFIDVIHLVFRLRPRVPNAGTWKDWRALPERRLAILIPAWQEASVLEAMVQTNLARIRYREYKWFIGVYPNDEATMRIAQDLHARHPDKVEVVVTDRDGPTSKAHCLNCILKQVGISGYRPHRIAIHDAEDVIHPDAFTVVNAQDEALDFIQLPIFSLKVPVREWVSGTYLDEFAEIHLKEIPVRKILRMPIPSAGVGTFFTARILARMAQKYGYCFDESNLTEDYEISLRIARSGGAQDFLLIRDEQGAVVATREYFPHELKRSIRQKTRWTTGIALQTTLRWRAFGVFSRVLPKIRDIPLLYGLFRDRKSLWSNPTVLVAWAMAPVAVFHAPSQEGALLLFHVNLASFGVRLIQRGRFCGTLYGWRQGLMSVPRVLLSNLINSLACVRAIHEFFRAPLKRNQRQIRWDKTDHRFPDLKEVA